MKINRAKIVAVRKSTTDGVIYIDVQTRLANGSPIVKTYHCSTNLLVVANPKEIISDDGIISQFDFKLKYYDCIVDFELSPDGKTLKVIDSLNFNPINNIGFGVQNYGQDQSYAKKEVEVIRKAQRPATNYFGSQDTKDYGPKTAPNYFGSQDHLFTVPNKKEYGPELPPDLGVALSNNTVIPPGPAPMPPKEETSSFTPIEPEFIPVLHKGWRFGHAVVRTKPEVIRYRRNSFVQESASLRMSDTFKSPTGYSYETYSMSWKVNGVDQIYSDIKEILDQILLQPFHSVEGGPFKEINHDAITVTSYMLSTVPGEPESLNLTLNFDPFMWDYWTDQAFREGEGKGQNFDVGNLGEKICFPLLEMWTKTRSRSIFNPEDKALNGFLSLELPTEIGGERIRSLITNKPPIGVPDDILSFDTIEALEGNGATPASLNVRQIENLGSTDRLYAIKLDNQELFNEIVHGEVKPDWYIGLIEWSKVNLGLLADAFGNVVPASYVVPAASLPTKGTQNSTSVYDQVLDIKKTDSLDTTISSYYTLKKLAEIEPTGGTYDQAADLSKGLIEAAKTHTANYFAVVVQLNNKNRQYFNQFVRKSNSYTPKTLDEVDPLLDTVDDVFDTKDAVDIQNSLYIDGTSNDIIIEAITGAGGHKVSTNHVNVMSLPVHQYNGGQGKVFTIEGNCFGSEAKEKIKRFKEEFDRRALAKQESSYKDSSPNNEAEFEEIKTPGVFAKVTGEIFQLLGVNFVMPVSLEMTTVPGQPGVWRFSLSLIDFNPRTQLAEKVKFLPTANQKNLRTLKYNVALAEPGDRHPLILKVEDEFSLNTLIAQENVYPDLDLPTVVEFKSWIKAFRNFATAYSLGQPLPNYGSVFGSIVTKYIGASRPSDNVARMVNWATDEELEKSYSIGYVDPDFYLFYHANDSFHNSIEHTMQSFIGDMDAVLSSSGKVKNETDVVPIVRFKDERYNFETVGGPETFANNESSLEKLFTEQKAAINVDGDELIGQEILKQEEEAAATLKEEGKKIGWWAGGVFDYARDNISLVNLPDLHTKPIGPNDIMPVGTASKESPRNQEEALATFQKEINEAGEEFRKFLSYQERAKYLLRALRESLTTIPKQQNFARKAGFVINTDQRTETQIFREIDNPNTQRKLNGTKITSLADWYKVTVSQLKGKSYSEERNNNVNSDGMTLDVQDFSQDLSFLARTIITNNQWERASEKTQTKLVQKKVLNKAILFNIDYFNSVGKKYNLDPHIIKAWFIYRTNLGINKPNVGDGGVGFGNISNKYATDKQIPDTPEAHIDLLAQTLSKYYTKFRDYTLALIATDLELTVEGESLNETGLASVIKKLEDFSIQIVKNFSNKKKKADLINQATLISKFPSKFNQYYRTWLQLARTLGPYYIRTNDIYYTYENVEILTDSILDDQTETVRNGYVSNYTPAGGTIAYDDGRTFERVSAEIYNEEVNPDFSAETRSQLAYKMKQARIPDNETAIWGMLHDFRRYSPYGRLKGAYPAYFILLINEGYYWRGGSEKLWDQFYTRTAVNSIEVVRSRDEPGSVATIEFSNVFSWLTRYTAQKALYERLTKEERDRAIRDYKHPIQWIQNLYSREVLKELDDELLGVWQKNHLNFLMLGAGARLQIRMGYGSRPLDLPIIFNGTVTEVPTTETSVQIIAIGDGAELKKPSVNKLERTESGYAYQNTGGWFGIAKSPANIVVESLINREGFNSVLSKISQGRYWRDFSHGIAHFGDVFEEGLLHYPAEVQINIYDSSPTILDQSIPGITNFFNTHAAYNWDQSKTWFSVSVSEPNPWRVLQVCANAVLDFIGAADHFGLRSSVFYGKWWWPYNYTYNSSILDLEDKEIYQGVRSNNDELLKKFVDFISNKSITAETKEIPFEDVPEEIRASANLKYPSKIWSPGFGLQVGHKPTKIVRILKTTTDSENKQINYVNYTITYELENQSNGFTNIVTPALSPIIKAVNDNSESKVFVFEKINYAGATYQVPQYDKETKTYKYNPINLARSAARLTNPNSVDYIAANCNWKPYTQVYFANSLFNIIGCNIKADATQVATDAIGLHTYNAILGKSGIYKNATWCIDDDIQPAQRKTVQVNTGIMLNAFQGSFSNFFRGVTTNTVGAVVNNFVPGFNDFVNAVPPSPAVENGVIAGLLDTVKRMYQGHLTMIGTPSIKPHDIIFMDDYKTGLRGPIKVRTVVHRFDSEVGMVSIITPDCVVLPQNSTQGVNFLVALQTVANQSMKYYALRKGALASWNLLRYTTQPHYFSKTSQAKMLRGKYIQDKYGIQIQSLADETTKVTPKVTKPASSKGTKAAKSKGAKSAKKSAPKLVATNPKIREAAKLIAANTEETIVDLVDLLGLDPKEIEVLKADTEDFRDIEKVNEWIKARLGEKKFNNADEIIAKIEKARLEKLSDIFDDPEVIKELAGALPDGGKDLALKEAFAVQLEAVTKELGVTDLDSLDPEALTDSQKRYYNKNKELIDELQDAMKKVGEPEELIPKTSLFENLIRKMKGQERKDLFKGVEEIAELNFFKARQALANTFQWESATVLEFYRSVIRGRGLRNLKERITSPFTKASNEAKVAKEAAETAKAAAAEAATAAAAGVDNAEEGADAAVKARKKVKDAGKLLGETLAGKGKALKDAVKDKEVLDTILKNGKSVRTGVRLGMLAGPQIVIGLAKEVMFIALGNSLLDSTNHYLKSRQCAKIIPLFVNGTPWVAGINGHAGAVIGDTPSWFDNALSSFIRTGSINNDSTDYGAGAMSFGMAFLGIDQTAVNYDYQSPADVQYRIKAEGKDE